MSSLRDPMNERVRRPLLTLKLGTPSAKPDEEGSPAAAPPPSPPAVTYTWKCRPCGAALIPPAEGPDDEAVRCPACNARVGRAGDFRLDPPPLERLRARAVKVVPHPVAVSAPRVRPPVVMVKVLKKAR
jgi:DNA-directed RNA polymerase subunit RPC12/RpoP